MYTAGIDIGSTYTKVVVMGEGGELVGTSMTKTGFRLAEAASDALRQALASAGLSEADIAYIITTGYGRYQVPFRDVQVTDLTAHSRGARFFFPNTRTVLDIGGQTMKALRVDAEGRVRAFRLNDKCAAGTGAFLEKTAHYLGMEVEEIGRIVDASKQSVPISGVCAVFAESEVINHITEGVPAGDIFHGAIVSLVGRAVQLMRRVGMEPEYTLAGGIMRFGKMVQVVGEQLEAEVNVLPDELVQLNGAVGAALLGHRRLKKLAENGQLEAHLAKARSGRAALAGEMVADVA